MLGGNGKGGGGGEEFLPNVEGAELWQLPHERFCSRPELGFNFWEWVSNFLFLICV